VRRLETAATGNQPQPKTRSEFSAIMRTATGQTCNGTFDPTHARKIALATRAPVKIAPSTFANWEREIVTTLLVSNPKIATSLPPFNAMRKNPASARTKLRQDMRQLVLQSSLDFGWVLKQTRV
jgi:hypothetical protein